MRQASVDRGECVSCAAKSVRVGETFGRETLLKSDFCSEKNTKSCMKNPRCQIKFNLFFKSSVCGWKWDWNVSRSRCCQHENTNKIDKAPKNKRFSSRTVTLFLLCHIFRFILMKFWFSSWIRREETRQVGYFLQRARHWWMCVFPCASWLAESAEDALIFNTNVPLVGWGLERSNQCFLLALVAVAP